MDRQSLAARLREDTRDAHGIVESTPFVRQLFSGRATPALYRRYLRQLHAVYTALEETGPRSAPVAHLFDPALSRADALAQDLDWWFESANWQDEPIADATSTYVDRIGTVANREPVRLIAHHYVRYLGDLSGGQAIKRVVCRVYGLTGEVGSAFYAFPHIPDPETYKALYRSRLDGFPLDAASIDAVVDEAQQAFDLNKQLFEALATG